jgi:transposase-like protein
MAKSPKSYSATFKFQVVLEMLNHTHADAELARKHGVHPITVAKWKGHFLEHGPELFRDKAIVKDYEQRIAELERLLGQKEVEIALLKNFLATP